MLTSHSSGIREHPPKSFVNLNVDGIDIPFFTVEDLILSKIRTCGRRQKDRDVEDIENLLRKYKDDLDYDKIKEKVRRDPGLFKRIESQYPRDDETRLFSLIDQFRPVD